MSATRKSALLVLTVTAALLAAAAWLWSGHARAWDLGGSSPILSYDAAQYAVAARELSDHRRLATLYALPLELSRHPTPPWPLSLVQPGTVLAEAVLFRLAGPPPRGRPESREPLVLALPSAAYAGIALLWGLGLLWILGSVAPGLSRRIRAMGAIGLGLVFLLDPEAQHFAIGGFTELPFTLGLSLALMSIALGWAARRPLAFGLLLGVTGLFRANMLWMAPILAVAAAASAPSARRRVLALTLLGFALPLLPWWIYKWRAFGNPAWDLSWIALWDGVQGRSWFSLNHLPDLPQLPSGSAAWSAVATKILRNIPGLLLQLTQGPRALWIGALAIALLASGGARAGAAPAAETPPPVDDPWRGRLRAAGAAALALLAISVLATAASVPQSRYLFPARVCAELAGAVALGALIAHAPATLLGPATRRIALGALGVLAIVWGGFETGRGLMQGRSAAESRGVPTRATMLDLAAQLDLELGPNEPVMSNLGPVLAWYARRPVVHLALGPADVDACRKWLEFRTVLLVFRDPVRAWSEWPQVMQRPDEAAHRPEWNIARALRFTTEDGFVAVWLELGPATAPVASVSED